MSYKSYLFYTSHRAYCIPHVVKTKLAVSESTASDSGPRGAMQRVSWSTQFDILSI